MGEHRMIRFSMTALAVALMCLIAGPTVAEDPKPKIDTKPATETKPPVEPKSSGASPQAQKINEMIAKGWESAGIKKPAEKANDFEFMRRAFIDLIGRIPTPEEIIDFELDKSTNKRAKLVHRLLNEEKYKLKTGSGKLLATVQGLKTNNGEINYNEAYAENFAELWTTWMLSRTNTLPDYRRQFHFWLETCFLNDTKVNDVKYPSGVPWNKIVYTVISATGKSNVNN